MNTSQTPARRGDRLSVSAVIPDTINLHLLYRCNANCVYCYRPTGDSLPVPEWHGIIDQIARLSNADRRARRINFAGGEPTLIRELPELVRHARSAGLRTSIITNGRALASVGLSRYVPWIDMVGISIDSTHEDTNRALGRPLISTARWIQVASEIRAARVALKINTVVSRLNCHEDMASFVALIRPDRWKILRAIEIDGINAQNSDSWRVSDDEFEQFVQRHLSIQTYGIKPVVEDEDDLRGSYAMITPDGCFYDSVDGGYRKSRPIQVVGLEAAFQDVQFSDRKFLRRGGRYVLPTIGGGL